MPPVTLVAPPAEGKCLGEVTVETPTGQGKSPISRRAPEADEAEQGTELAAEDVCKRRHRGRV